MVVRDSQEVDAKLKAVAGDKYSYRQMDDYTDLIEKTLKSIPQVSKVSRSGLLNENVFLLYSQERLASYNIQPGTLEDAMRGRNISTSGGQVNVEGKNVTLEPGGEFKSEQEIGNVQVRASNGTMVYVRDLVDVVRGYESPARFQNFFNWKDGNGNWQTKWETKDETVTDSYHVVSSAAVPPATFDVEPGKVVYIGRVGMLLNIDLPACPPRGSPPAASSHVVQCLVRETFFESQPDADLAMIRQRFPRLAGVAIEVQPLQTAPGSWQTFSEAARPYMAGKPSGQ